MRDLSQFQPSGYDRGRSRVWQALWHFVSFLFFQPFWVPRLWRPAILRLFGAKVGRGVIIRHDVRIMWPWKLSIGDHILVGRRTAGYQPGKRLRLERMSAFHRV